MGQEFLKEVGDEWLASVLIGQKNEKAFFVVLKEQPEKTGEQFMLLSQENS